MRSIGHTDAEARVRVPNCVRSDSPTPASLQVLSNGETQTRTGDTTIFSRVLYQLSYLAGPPRCYRLPGRRARRPASPARGSGSGVRRASIWARRGSSQGGSTTRRPSSASGAMTREAGAVVGDLVEHAARLAEVDRVEEVAVDDRRAAHALRAARCSSQRGCSADRRAPGDVVDRAGALDAGAPSGAGSNVILAPRRSPRSSNVALADRRGAEHARRAARGSRSRAHAVRAHAGEAEQRVLGRDLGVAGAQRRVGHVLDEQLVLEPLGVGEAHRPPARPRARPRARARRSRPEVERVRRADPPHDAVRAARRRRGRAPRPGTRRTSGRRRGRRPRRRRRGGRRSGRPG